MGRTPESESTLFHSFAVRDRINLVGLSTQLAAACNPSPRNMALGLVPSTENDTNLFSNIATLVSRIIVTHIPLFQFAFSDVTNWHIQHRFYSNMSKKSEVVSAHMCTNCNDVMSDITTMQVSLGILLKNENKG